VNNQFAITSVPSKLTYCTVCMNRLNHLRETLPINLQNNERFKNVQFLVLDYNSSDGLESWIKDTLSRYVEGGRLIYYKNPEPELFDRSHSKNMAAKLAEAEIVCNVDSDNIVLTEYTEFVLEKFRVNNNIFITADSGRLYHVSDLVGRICCLKKDFVNVGGYDESLSGYGFEDNDIIARLTRLGREQVIVENVNLLSSIKHDNNDRIKNEKVYRKLHSIYLLNLDNGIIKFIVLLNDYTFEYGTVIPSKYKLPGTPGVDFSLEESGQGTWENSEGVDVVMNESKGMHMKMSLEDEKTFSFRLIDDEKNEIFNKLSEQDDIDEAILMFMMVRNQEKYQQNNQLGAIEVNRDGFGNGLVYKNFEGLLPIYLS